MEVVPTSRFAGLLSAAVDDALMHGIAGLSLRPLAARLGTSDRMLVYHFGTKDELVAAIIESSGERASDALAELPAAPDPSRAVSALWALYRRPDVAACMRIYVQAAALGLLGSEPYQTAARRSNETWSEAVADLLQRSGAPAEQARRAGDLVDATLFGLVIDQPLDSDEASTIQIVDDLAATVRLICT